MTDTNSFSSFDGLEMEEVEGLIAVEQKSSVGIGRSKRNAGRRCNNCNFNTRTCRIALALIVACAFLGIWLAATSSPDDSSPLVLEATRKPTALPTTPPPTPPPPPTETPTPPPKLKTDLKIPTLKPDPYHLPISIEQRDDITNAFGQWHFWDGDANQRPKEDYCGAHTNRDIPGIEFPDSSWQVDAVYVNHFLNDAEKLVGRTMEAIFQEVGHGKPLPASGLMERMKMFHWDTVNLESATEPSANFKPNGSRENGGWTTSRSYQGLVRRLLHAAMTRDSFTVVVAGDANASGQGNHFHQSYAMQFHQVMEPVFTRLGVKLTTRNMGASSIEGQRLVSSDILGSDIDLFIWDSETEVTPRYMDLLLRQVLLGSKSRVPVIWASGSFDILKKLHNEANVDVGQLGLGTHGIPVTQDKKQAESLPFAVRYFFCSEEFAKQEPLCGEQFERTCWIDRDDGIKPEAPQVEPQGGSRGWRQHQHQGHVLAFSVLEALQSAINTWSEGTMSGQPLDDSYWHMSDYYNTIREGLKNLQGGPCAYVAGTLPERLCQTPLQARTQYTPRANFEETGITSILQPAQNGYLPKNTKVVLYDGPDVHNPNYDIPPGEVDVFAVAMNRRRLETTHDATATQQQQQHDSSSLGPYIRRVAQEEIVSGTGWQVWGEPPGSCSGQYLDVCGRSTDNPCVLEGKQDYQGSIAGSATSGWLVWHIPKMTEGILVIEFQLWQEEGAEEPANNDEPNDDRKGDDSKEPDANQEKKDDSKANDAKKDNAAKNDDAKADDSKQEEAKKGDDGKKDDTAKKDENEKEQNKNVDNNDSKADASKEEKAKEGDAKKENKNKEQDKGGDKNEGSKQEKDNRRAMQSNNDVELPKEFFFDYAIQGKVTSLDKTEFLKHSENILVLLNEKDFGEQDNVKAAIRLRGSGPNIMFGLSHVYWA